MVVIDNPLAITTMPLQGGLMAASSSNLRAVGGNRCSVDRRHGRYRQSFGDYDDADAGWIDGCFQ